MTIKEYQAKLEQRIKKSEQDMEDASKKGRLTSERFCDGKIIAIGRVIGDLNGRASLSPQYRDKLEKRIKACEKQMEDASKKGQLTRERCLDGRIVALGRIIGELDGVK